MAIIFFSAVEFADTPREKFGLDDHRTKTGVLHAIDNIDNIYNLGPSTYTARAMEFTYQHTFDYVSKSKLKMLSVKSRHR